MKEVYMLKDILESRISNQVFYNRNLIDNRNPEARSLFTEMREDETRAIRKLQQKIEKRENAPGIIERIITARPRY